MQMMQMKMRHDASGVPPILYPNLIIVPLFRPIMVSSSSTVHRPSHRHRIVDRIR